MIDIFKFYILYQSIKFIAINDLSVDLGYIKISWITVLYKQVRISHMVYKGLPGFTRVYQGLPGFTMIRSLVLLIAE